MKKAGLVVFAAAVVTLTAFARQDGPPPPPMGGPPHGAFHFMLGGPDGFMHDRKVVTGAPYSATATDQFLQTLADGNTIQHTTTAQVARDSQGRTYRQQTLTGGPWAAARGGARTIVLISDPVAGYSYVLHPDRKEAIRRHIRAHHSPTGGPPGTDEGNVHFQNKNAIETDLGSKEIPGLGIALGKSVTHTIAAGEIGNEQPIVSTSEIWSSRDLQIVVLSKHSDPRTGESTYSLSNIQRAEPNAALFKVPAGYSIRDAANVHGRSGPPE